MTRDAWCSAAGAAAHVLVADLPDEIEIGGADGHHLQRVRRIGTGEAITAADGTGRWRRYEVAASPPGRLRLTAAGAVACDPVLRPGLAVGVALTKGERPDTVVRHCSELGVDAVRPVVASRSVVRWDADRAAAAVERLRRVAREAAAQCRRARLLRVEPVAPLASLAGHPGLLVADRAGRPAGDHPDPPGGAWLVVVGPEGGLTVAEVTELGDPPRLAVGPHILRAETAALAAAAALAERRHPTR